MSIKNISEHVSHENISNQKPSYEILDCCSMAPSIITTTASLAGVIALNILQYHYCSIVFAVGAIGGSYTIYQSYRFRMLKTFQENNAELEASVTTLQEKIAALKEQTSKMKNSLNDFEQQNQHLSDILNQQKIENDKLHGQINTLQLETAQLKQINADFEANATQHVEQLSALSSSLKDMEESVFSDHRVFSEKLAIFRDNVVALTKVRKKIDGSVNRSMNAFNERLEQTAKEIEKVFFEIERWKNPKEIASQLDVLQQLNKMALEVQKTIACDKGRAKVMKTNIEDLKAIETKFRAALELLQEELKELNKIIEQKRRIVEGVRQLVQEIKELPTDSPLTPKILELIHLL